MAGFSDGVSKLWIMEKDSRSLDVIGYDCNQDAAEQLIRREVRRFRGNPTARIEELRKALNQLLDKEQAEWCDEQSLPAESEGK